MRFQEGIEAFRIFYLEEDYSPNTVLVMARHLAHLSRFLESRGISSWEGLTPELARDYQVELLHLPLHGRSVRLTALRRMGDLLLREKILSIHPGSGLKVMPADQYSPIEPLSLEEVEAILSACDLGSRQGIRDHALLTVLWEGCLTFLDASRLLLDHVSSDLSSILVYGKVMNRVVPLSEEGKASLSRYLDSVRPHFTRFRPDAEALFLTAFGRVFEEEAQGTSWPRLVGPYLKEARILKKVSGHAFKWARVKHLLGQGVPKDELRGLAGFNKYGFDRFLKRLS